MIFDTERASFLNIDLDAFSHNFQQLRQYVSKAKIMAVVKANAYGHGLIPCATYLQQWNVDYLAVAFVEEGLQLRQAGITTPILVLGGIIGQQIQLFLHHQLDMTASSIAKLEAIEAMAAQLKIRARVHLKFDTGMGRIGVRHDNANLLLEKSLMCKNCDIVGIYSHFATSEELDKSFAEQQIEHFETIAHFYQKKSLPLPLRHMANSGAILQFPQAHYDIVRPGLCLYGISPARHLDPILPLKPVLSLHSKVVYFKVLKKGMSVSYGRSWTTDRDTRLVTIPLGYGDGYSRALSNCGNVFIRGQKRPIVGKICMDQLMVDLGPQGEAYNGDDVILIGQTKEDSISVRDLAELAQTVPHDILTHLNLRLPRRYFLNHKLLNHS